MADSKVTEAGTKQRTVASTTAGETMGQLAEHTICGGYQ